MCFLQGDDSKKGKKKKSADLVELPFDSELPGKSKKDCLKSQNCPVSSI